MGNHFDTPKAVLDRIRWLVRIGAIDDPDLQLVAQFYESGEIRIKQGRGAPSKLHEHLQWAKMVVRERLGGTSRIEAIRNVAHRVHKEPDKTIEPIYREHCTHAEALVRQEDIVAGVEKLLPTLKYDDAIAEVADDSGMKEWEVRLHHQHWKLNFPSQLRDLATSAQ